VIEVQSGRRIGEGLVSKIERRAVESAYERRKPGSDPEWVYWLTEDEITVMAGRCYVELGQAMVREWGDSA
jgi:hypothetical protein